MKIKIWKDHWVATNLDQSDHCLTSTKRLQALVNIQTMVWSATYLLNKQLCLKIWVPLFHYLINTGKKIVGTHCRNLRNFLPLKFFREINFNKPKNSKNSHFDTIFEAFKFWVTFTNLAKSNFKAHKNVKMIFRKEPYIIQRCVDFMKFFG